MIFKNPAILNLTKCFLSPFLGDKNASMLSLLAWLPGGISDVKKVSINFEMEGEVAPHLEFLNSAPFAGLECFFALNAFDRMIFSFVRLQHFSQSIDSSPIYELTLVREREDLFQKEIEFMGDVNAKFVLHAGYSRLLRANFSPVSESKERRGFFGGTSVSVVQRKESWLMPNKSPSLGAVKGVYPVNFWRSKAVENLLKIGFKLPSECLGSEGIVCFDEGQQKKISKENPEFSKFIHFDAL